MSIIYTYQIISVDESARCMEVVYSADGHQTMHIGVRLPYEGESLETLIDSFSPVALWEERTRSVVVPTVGQSGEIDPASFIVAPITEFVEQTTD
jgi:hypothetical protein